LESEIDEALIYTVAEVVDQEVWCSRCSSRYYDVIHVLGHPNTVLTVTDRDVIIDTVKTV
jgi:hypothetical protein